MGSDYRSAGVDLQAAEQALDGIREAVQGTYNAHVLQGLGAFGGMFALPAGYKNPVLVASCDGVGTKTRLALRYGGVRAVGADLVNHCINDIAVQGATPLFFLDYFASARLDPQQVADAVLGMAEACKAAGVALLGGETAEMPGVYAAGEIDVVGTMVGVVERDQVINGRDIAVGDCVLALASGGLQTNGFSLARAVSAGHEDEPVDPENPAAGSIAQALLAPHRSFLGSIQALTHHGWVRGMAHITGGGIPGNLPRILPAGIGAEIHLGSWPVPPIFARLQALGGIDDAEMRNAFNMGVGLVLVVGPQDVEAALSSAPEPLHVIGRVVATPGVHFIAP